MMTTGKPSPFYSSEASSIFTNEPNADSTGTFSSNSKSGPTRITTDVPSGMSTRFATNSPNVVSSSNSDSITMTADAPNSVFSGGTSNIITNAPSADIPGIISISSYSVQIMITPDVTSSVSYGGSYSIATNVPSLDSAGTSSKSSMMTTVVQSSALTSGSSSIATNAAGTKSDSYSSGPDSVSYDGSSSTMNNMPSLDVFTLPDSATNNGITESDITGTPDSAETSSSIKMSRSASITNATSQITVPMNTSEVTNSPLETTGYSESLPPQCELQPEILKTMCTSLVLNSVTVNKAGVTMQKEVMNIFLSNLFQQCSRRSNLIP